MHNAKHPQLTNDKFYDFYCEGEMHLMFLIFVIVLRTGNLAMSSYLSLKHNISPVTLIKIFCKFLQ